MGSTCTTPPGSLAAAGPRGQGAEWGSSCHSVPEELAALSSTQLLRFRTGSLERSPRLQFPWPRKKADPRAECRVSPPLGRCGVSGASEDRPSLELGWPPPPPLAPSRECVLRTLALGHIPPASLQPRCCGCNANKRLSGWPSWAATQSPGGGREAPFSPSAAEAGGAGEDSGLCSSSMRAQSEPGSHVPNSRPRVGGQGGGCRPSGPRAGLGLGGEAGGQAVPLTLVKAASLPSTHPPPTPCPSPALSPQLHPLPHSIPSPLIITSLFSVLFLFLFHR